MTSLYKDIVENLKSKMYSGVFNEGEKLPSERELSLEFDVSRNVVREAISVLRAQGLVRVHPGKGAYVKKPDPVVITETIEMILKNYNVTIDDVLEVRESLEKTIIKKAVEKATPDDINELNIIYLKMEKNKLNVDLFVELDEKFHTSLANCSKNPLHYILLNTFLEITHHILFALTRLIPESAEAAQVHHKEIIEALTNKDEKRALAVMNSHMKLLREDIKELQEEDIIR